jgi:phage regulator Rha-like protein
MQRFPKDFMFKLTEEEFEDLRTQFATSSWGGTRYLPFAFTEQGVAMLSSVLSGAKAIEVNIQIVRAFVFLRQFALSNTELTEKLRKLESRYDQQFKDVYEAINFLLQKDAPNDSSNSKKIGF